MNSQFFRPVSSIEVAVDVEVAVNPVHLALCKTADDLVDALAEGLTRENVTFIEGLIGQFKADLTLVKAGLVPLDAGAS